MKTAKITRLMEMIRRFARFDFVESNSHTICLVSNAIMVKRYMRSKGK